MSFRMMGTIRQACPQARDAFQPARAQNTREWGDNWSPIPPASDLSATRPRDVSHASVLDVCCLQASRPAKLVLSGH